MTKLDESFWWEYYGSGLIGNKRPNVRKFKWKNLWLLIVSIWCIVVTFLLILK